MEEESERKEFFNLYVQFINLLIDDAVAVVKSTKGEEAAKAAEEKWKSNPFANFAEKAFPEKTREK